MRGNEGRNTNSKLLCLACYEDRLASVFDNAPDLKLFRVEDHKICPAGYLSLPSKDPKDRTSAIIACGATFLICGAICGCTMNELEQAGTKVIPWISGMIDDVLSAYQQNCLENHVMPGCRGRGRCGQGNRGFRARRPPQNAMHAGEPSLNPVHRSK
ncbi:NifB/NifX family molybdenum-iron cluster-binding protein [Desulfovibrio sp. JC010]|uniref:NifB/NifX family molybdenum-iron cluster-binding protein n=1 Tax=Desulfovibrio sp. JC010 TaxID=2593641 RepID=UPI0013D2228F|nr:NifB/NifX family molybdenum-iron cluster-binding protein [Desulfovibrio sp. JC010]NDV26632.1 dinitrogenase iron-molybdenum cofactor biosynthesis protein [Desulfovibrio sp. JC010]